MEKYMPEVIKQLFIDAVGKFNDMLRRPEQITSDDERTMVNLINQACKEGTAFNKVVAQADSSQPQQVQNLMQEILVSAKTEVLLLLKKAAELAQQQGITLLAPDAQALLNKKLTDIQREIPGSIDKLAESQQRIAAHAAQQLQAKTATPIAEQRLTQEQPDQGMHKP